MNSSISPNKNFEAAVRQQVIGLFREILSDPDFGLELNPRFNKGLQQSVKDYKQGRYKTLDQILKKYKRR